MALQDGSCRSLGSRLRALEDQSSQASINNGPLNFEMSDWQAEGRYFQMTIPSEAHASGALPLFQCYEKRGQEYHCVQLDSIILDVSGEINVRVLAEPDLRFAGRFIFDE